MPEPTYGQVDGYPEGSEFTDRWDLYRAGVHRHNQMGIVGSAREGAESIVLSGNYEDDLDHGDRIIYTGEGGNHPGTGQQIADQEPVRGNRALMTSFEMRRPVRVVRGSRHRSEYSPKAGFRYDGLYEVVRYVVERGKSGFVVFRFELSKLRSPIE